MPESLLHYVSDYHLAGDIMAFVRLNDPDSGDEAYFETVYARVRAAVNRCESDYNKRKQAHEERRARTNGMRYRA